MSTGLAKVTAKAATEICKRFEVGEEAEKLLGEGQTPRQYLELLLEKAQYIDAIRFLAFALPKREAVWWACQCVRTVSGATPPPKATAAIQATERWIVEQKDEGRWAAKAAADATRMEHPAGLAAMAVFWAGGSISPPDTHPVPAPEHLTALVAAGAIMLAAVFTEADQAAQKFRSFLALGIDVADGKSQWK